MNDPLLPLLTEYWIQIVVGCMAYFMGICTMYRLYGPHELEHETYDFLDECRSSCSKCAHTIGWTLFSVVWPLTIVGFIVRILVAKPLIAVWRALAIPSIEGDQ